MLMSSFIVFFSFLTHTHVGGRGLITLEKMLPVKNMKL